MKDNFFKSRLHSFKNAIIGWWHVIRTQKNAWIHAVATLMVIAISIWLQLSFRDLAVLVVTIAVVWSAEFLNTALEIVVDLASPEKHPLAKVGKDVGAASVLIAAGAAVIVGIFIMGPPLVEKIRLIIEKFSN